MRKVYMLLLTVVMALALSGCVQGKFTMKINDDGSGDITMRIGMGSAIAGMAQSQGEDPFKDMIAEAEKEGYKITRFTNENDQTGFEAKKSYKNVNDFFKKDKLFMDEGSADKGEITVKKSFFSKSYSLKATLDMTQFAMDKSLPKEEQEMQQMFLSQMKFDYEVQLPAKAGKNNASKASADGKTLTWNLKPGTKNELEAVAKKTNTQNVALVSFGVLVVIAVLVLVFMKMRKSGQTPEDINTGI